MNLQVTVHGLNIFNGGKHVGRCFIDAEVAEACVHA